MRAKLGAASTPHRADFTASIPSLSDATEEEGLSDMTGEEDGGDGRCTDSEGLVCRSYDNCVKVSEKLPVCGQHLPVGVALLALAAASCPVDLVHDHSIFGGDTWQWGMDGMGDLVGGNRWCATDVPSSRMDRIII